MIKKLHHDAIGKKAWYAVVDFLLAQFDAFQALQLQVDALEAQHLQTLNELHTLEQQVIQQSLLPSGSSSPSSHSHLTSLPMTARSPPPSSLMTPPPPPSAVSGSTSTFMPGEKTTFLPKKPYSPPVLPCQTTPQMLKDALKTELSQFFGGDCVKPSDVMRASQSAKEHPPEGARIKNEMPPEEECGSEVAGAVGESGA